MLKLIDKNTKSLYNMETTKTRQATKEDFFVGSTLTTSEGYDFTIISKYDKGIWEARGEAGDNCIYEDEAKFYTINVK